MRTHTRTTDSRPTGPTGSRTAVRPAGRRPRRTLAALATAALTAGALLLPAATASAHVRVVPEATAAGGWTVLTVRVPNESATAATSKVVLDLPTDTPFLSVSTKPVPGWTAVVDRGELPEPVEVDGSTVTEAPLHVTWTADPGAEIGQGQFQELEISVGPLPEAGTTLVMPAHQTYTDGTVVDWAQVADGDEEPDQPAPTFTTTEAAAGGHHGTATDDATEAAADASDDAGSGDATAVAAGHDGAAASASAEGSDDTVARVLGGVGLVLGLAALVVAVAGRRRGGAQA